MVFVSTALFLADQLVSSAFQWILLPTGKFVFFNLGRLWNNNSDDNEELIRRPPKPYMDFECVESYTTDNRRVITRVYILDKSETIASNKPIHL